MGELKMGELKSEVTPATTPRFTTKTTFTMKKNDRSI
jgi:hypothetical protein